MARLLAATLIGAMIASLQGAGPMVVPARAATMSARACPAPVRMMVRARVEPAAVRADFRLDEIAELADRSGRRASHRPLGFYLGRIAYEIKLQEMPSEISGCPPIVEVRASLALVDRKIEIGRDLGGTSCLYQRALLHYSRHSRADEEIFTKFVDNIRIRLKDSSTMLGEPRGVDPRREGDRVEEIMRGLINKALLPLDRTRSAAQSSVDTPEQIDLMNAATCNRDT